MNILFNRHTRKYLKLPSEEIEYKNIKVDEQLSSEERLFNYYQELNILKVKIDGLNLEYVHDQTTEICKIAVQNNPHALKFVNIQTREICILALNSSLECYRNPVHILAHIKDDNLRNEIYETNKNLIRNQINDFLVGY